MATKAALITSARPAGIAVIRVAGPDCAALVRALCPGLHAAWPAPGTDFAEPLSLSHAHDDIGLIDQVVIAPCPELTPPALDINCHGGPRVIQRLLARLAALGAALVEAPDLWPDATLAGEVIRSLPRARTPLAVRALANQETAGLARWTAAALARLAQDPAALAAIQADIETRLLPSQAVARALLAGIAIVLVGPPNVGKSTLANALGGRRQSLVSDQPGATRDFTAADISFDGLPVRLLDTAGLRPPADDLEAESQRRAAALAVGADLVIFVTEPATAAASAQALLDNLAAPAPVLPVLNKVDLLPAGAAPTAAADVAVAVSALNGLNLSALRNRALALLGLNNLDPAAPLVFTPRQARLLNDARHCGAAAALAQLLRRVHDPEQ